MRRSSEKGVPFGDTYKFELSTTSPMQTLQDAMRASARTYEPVFVVVPTRFDINNLLMDAETAALADSFEVEEMGDEFIVSGVIKGRFFEVVMYYDYGEESPPEVADFQSELQQLSSKYL